ncbi:MAG: hypothetical protein HYY13_10335 [Nitrospirae bacterium]|nr:hypothetical protein [Nitrospirota bacterium]
MKPIPSASALARKLVDALVESGIEYALGGALAYGYWAPPRGTIDVDLTLFLDPPDWPRGVGVLRQAGCEVDPKRTLEGAKDRGDVRLWCEGMRVDVYFPSLDFYGSVRRRRVTKTLEDRDVKILSAEDLSTLKALFNRGKDWVDIERMLAAQGASFDRSYVRDWIVRLVGEEDDRVLKWNEMTARIPPV